MGFPLLLMKSHNTQILISSGKHLFLLLLSETIQCAHILGLTDHHFWHIINNLSTVTFFISNQIKYNLRMSQVKVCLLNCCSGVFTNLFLNWIVSIWGLCNTNNDQTGVKTSKNVKKKLISGFQRFWYISLYLVTTDKRHTSWFLPV